MQVKLINEDSLPQYTIDYNLGVSVQSVYEVKKIDLGYFDEE